MKFVKIFQFELSYQLRHVSTWLLFAVLLLFGFIILRMVTLDEGTYLNAPSTIIFFSVFGSIIWLLIGGGVAGDAATRDVQTRMHPLTYTTPVSKLSYMGARFLTALFLNAFILLILYVGMLLSFYAPGAKAQFIGPFKLMSYLTAYGFITLPIVIAATAVQFTFAAWSGRAIAGYVASILLLMSHFVSTILKFGLEWKVLGNLLDLLGSGIVADMEGWTPIDMNTRLVLLEGMWFWNRLMWFSVAVAALVFTYYRFQLAHVTNGSKWSFFRQKSKSAKPTVEASSNTLHNHSNGTNTITLPPIVRDFTFYTYARQVRVIAWASFKTIARSRLGLTLVALLAIGTGLFATEYMEWLGVPLFARTEEVLRILAAPLNRYQTQWIVIPLLTIFYAGELIWREREAGIHTLTDTTPVPETVMFLGKFLGLALMITIWVAFLMMAGIINQLVMNYYVFEIDVYIKALFGIQLTNYLLFALLVYVIHVLVNQKYIGHMVAFCAYGFIMFSSMIGVEQKMLIYASDTGWSYSDMRGFGPFIEPWLWFKFYWAAWAFLLAMVATLFWVRSKEGGFKMRLHLAQHRIRQHKKALLLALTLVLVSGGYIFYNTIILNNYTTTADRMEMRAEYERRYGQYENVAQPTLARTKLHVEIYPEEQSADIQGTYFLVNNSKAPIDSIHLSTIPHLDLAGITFDRTASAVVVDQALGYGIYSLKKSLAPGDSVQMSFKMQLKPQGFDNSGVDASIVGNGSHITSDWMPIIGYNEDRQLRNARDREKYGLAPRPERPSLYNVEARNKTRHAALMEFEAVVGTSKDQVAVAPGTLLRTWTKGGRQYYQYATNAPILNGYALFSAKYALREAKWIPSSPSSESTSKDLVNESKTTAKPVTIQIYYHPAHDVNVDRMVKSAQASLEYYAQEFGPYPYNYFRVLERPGPDRGMHAESMTIDYQEGYSLMNPKPGGLDLPYHIMAHEMAHQWWGFQLTPAAVEGSGLLVESFATYSAMQVVEEKLGYEHLLQYLSQMRQEYEVPRSRAAPPLLRSNNAFMNYRKGPFALFALRNYIGKDKVNDALRQMLEKHVPAKSPLPTTLDFYRELQAVTPDSLQYLVHDLFAANTFWELKTNGASTKQTKTGKWQVTLKVEARKVVVDSIGVETNIPMKDWIEIGVYAPKAEGETSAKVLHLQKHRINSGKQKITVTVPQEPARAGIDPNYLLIDLDMEDNITKVNKEK